MKELSFLTKLYLAVIYLLGFVLLSWNAFHTAPVDLVMTLVLSILASLFLIFRVKGATNRSHYTFSFLIYGFALIHLSLGETMLVILISNFVEWIWNRSPLFIRLFNTCCYVSIGAFAHYIFLLINPSGSLSTSLGVFSVAISMGIFTLLNHLLVGIIVWLARGEDFKASGIFDTFPLVMDLTLLIFGAMLKIVFNASPYALILFMFPLYLIYATLRIPALERKTEVDQKTGLYNHHYFMQHLSKELDRANRFDRPLSIIMLDLDLLRNINNTYGHLAGDEVLTGISRILKNSVRDYDVVARFGGEEFSIMLPETTIQQSYERAEVIRRAIEWTEFNIPTSVMPIKITISLGIAERESFSQTAEEIIHNADAALYHSKLNGRNKASAYRDNAYINFIDKEQKVEAVAGGQLKNKTHQEPATKNESDYPAAKAKYIKVQPVSKLGDISATDKKSSKTVPLKPASHFQPVYIYIAGMVALVIALSFGLFRYEPFLYQINWIKIWPGLLTCALFVILTELFSIDLYLGKTSISTSAVPLLAGTILFGPVAGIILSAIFAIVVGIKYRSKFEKFIFNFCNQAIALILYTFILRFSVPSLENYSIGIQALFIILAALLVYITTTWMVSIGMGIDLKQSPGYIWKEQYAWLVTIYIGIGLVATAYIFGYRAQGVLGAFMMMGPLLLLRISQKQYVDRTREAVTELRGKNITLEKATEDIIQLNNGLLETLSEIVDLRDPHLLGHSKRVTSYATIIAKKMGLNSRQVELIRTGSLLHDIGKLGIPTDILAKPARLSNQEYEMIKRHPGIGARILERNPSLRLLIPIVRYHHEFFNGQGYPDGISGNQIPIEARIVSVADAIEAMESGRLYREAHSVQYIIDEIKKFSGTQFDPKVVDEAVKLLETKNLGEAVFSRDENSVAM